MIESDTQFGITLRAAHKFADTIRRHDSTPCPATVDPLLWVTERGGLASQLDDLNEELTAWIKVHGWDSDHDAITYLKMRGFRLLRSWHWRKPSAGYKPTPEEAAAVSYLFHEWDFGGYE